MNVKNRNGTKILAGIVAGIAIGIVVAMILEKRDWQKLEWVNLDDVTRITQF